MGNASVSEEIQGRGATVPVRGEGITILKRKPVALVVSGTLPLLVELCSRDHDEAPESFPRLAPPVEQSSHGESRQGDASQTAQTGDPSGLDRAQRRAQTTERS